MLNENGELKTFEQFRKDTEPIIGEYNRNWLRTEYDTAVIRARMAARFKQFQRDADLFPNLKWTESTSVVKREPHKDLYGLILPIEHPFWLSQYPGSLWNCKCGITNTDEPENSAIYHLDKYDIPTPPAGLEGNPAFTSKIFSGNNAYRRNAYAGSTKAVSIASDRLLRDYSREVVRAHFKKILSKPLKLDIQKGSKTIKLHITWQDMRTITAKPHKFSYFKNTCTYFLPEIVKAAKYIKPAEDIKPSKHPNVKQYHYWEFMLNSEKSYLVVEEWKNGEFHLHAIQDQDHFK